MFILSGLPTRTRPMNLMDTYDDPAQARHTVRYRGEAASGWNRTLVP